MSTTRPGDLTGAGGFGGLAALGLVGVVVGAIPFLGLLALVDARWPPLDQLDRALADGLNAAVAASPLAVDALSIVSELGGGATAGVVLGLATAWVLVRSQPRLAAYLAVTGVGLAVLVPVTKALVGRPRPDVPLPVVEIPTNASFPSGHAMTAMVTWGAVAVLALPVVRPARRRVLVAATLAFVVLVGFTRIALGVHFVTDVVAGWALGVAWLAVTAAAFRHWLRAHHQSVVHTGLGERPVHALHLRTIDEPALPDGGRTAGRLGVAALAIAGLLTATGLLVTGPLAGTTVGRWDLAVVAAVAERRTPDLTAAAVAVGDVGGLWGVVVAALTIASLGLAWRGSWRPAAAVLLAVGGEVVLYGVVSALVARPRPAVAGFTAGLPEDASFPSGHVAAVAVVYGVLCLLLIVHARGRWRWVVVAAAGVLVAATMAGRVYLAAHHPSDALAGLVMALLWLAALHRWVLSPTTDPPPTASWRYHQPPDGTTRRRPPPATARRASS